MSVRQKSGELMIITALYLSEPTFFFVASLKNGEKSTCSKILPVFGTVMISAISQASRSHVYHGVLINTILFIFSLLVLKPRNVDQYNVYVIVKGSALFWVYQLDRCTVSVLNRE